MPGKTLNTILSGLRIDLSDVAEGEWEATDLERAVERGLADLSRFLPRELTFDITLTSTIIENYHTIDLSDYIDAVDGMVGFIRVTRVEYPANQNPQNFVSWEIFANLLTITGGVESEGQAALSSGKILRIYYEAPHTMPEDEEPGSCPPFLDNTVILAASAYALFQRALYFNHQASDDFDDARTNLASATTAQTALGTALDNIKKYLDNNSDKDAAGVLEDITTDIAGLRTAILAAQDAANSELDAGDPTDINTGLADAASALDKVATYMEDNTSEDAKSWLTKITTDIAGLRTAILTAVDAMNTYLDSVADDLTAADGAIDDYMGTTNYLDGGAAPDVKKYLDDGDAFLNAIADGGEGQEVPLAYARFAEATRNNLIAPHERNRELLAQNATSRTNAAMIYAQEAAQRSSNLRSYIEQASGWADIARGFIDEAAQRIASVVQLVNKENVIVNRATGYISEAESRLGNLRSYIEQSNGYVSIANTFAREAEARLVDINTYLQEASHYESIANANMALADKYKEHAMERRDEVWTIWRDKVNFIGDFSYSSRRQMSS